MPALVKMISSLAFAAVAIQFDQVEGVQEYIFVMARVMDTIDCEVIYADSTADAPGLHSGCA